MAITNHYLFDTSTGCNDSVGSTNFTPYSGIISSGGVINQCLNWDVSTGAGTFPTGPNFAIPGIPNSVAFWIKLGSSVSTHAQVVLEQTTANVTLSTDSSNDVITVTVSSMTAFTIVLAGNALKSWTHIVLISNGYSGWTAYVNGAFYGPYTAMSSVPPGSTATAIGNGGSGASATANGSGAVTGGDLEKFSGDIIYVENRSPISRATDQIEDIKLIVQM